MSNADSTSDSSSGAFSVQGDIRKPWRSYLDGLTPIRPRLYKYCLKLTGNVWDAEDLCQSALAKVFSSLGKIDADMVSPEAYLMRTAKNLWIDTLRRAAREVPLPSPDELPVESKDGTLDADKAAYQLLDQLFPQERAALVLREVLGHTATEIADILATTEGAVKSALHRARARLSGEKTPAGLTPDPELVKQFMQALETTNLEAMRAICTSDLHVELVGGAEMESFEDSKNFFTHAHMVMPELGFGENPHWQLMEFQGETMVVGFRTLNGVEGINEIHRLEIVDAKISRIRCYCFCPDVLREIAAEMDQVSLDRPYRSSSFDDLA